MMVARRGGSDGSTAIVASTSVRGSTNIDSLEADGGADSRCVGRGSSTAAAVAAAAAAAVLLPPPPPPPLLLSTQTAEMMVAAAVDVEVDNHGITANVAAVRVSVEAD